MRAGAVQRRMFSGIVSPSRDRTLGATIAPFRAHFPISQIARSTLRSNRITCRTMCFEPKASLARLAYSEKLRAPVGQNLRLSLFVEIVAGYPPAIFVCPSCLVFLIARLARRHCLAIDESLIAAHFCDTSNPRYWKVSLLPGSKMARSVFASLISSLCADIAVFNTWVIAERPPIARLKTSGRPVLFQASHDAGFKTQGGIM